MGLDHTTSRTTIVVTQIVQCKSKILAHAYLYRPHTYNTKPFVPIGMESLIHKKTEQEEDLCPTLCNILGVRHLDIALTMLGPVNHKNKGKKSARYGTF